jgi:hypothetical protein
MSKTKSIALILGVLVMSLLIGYLIFAWTEPFQAPPGGNVAEPLNRSSNPQDKPARLTFTEFYDYNNPNYYVNPDGQSVLAGPVGIGTTPDTNYKLDVNGKIATPYIKNPNPADVNKDGFVNDEDLFLAIQSFGCTSSNACWNTRVGVDNLGNEIYKKDLDLVVNNQIDMDDIMWVLDKFNFSFTGGSSPLASKTGDINKDGVVNAEDVYFAIKSFGCQLGSPCWNTIIGLDYDRKYIRKKDADLNGDNKVDMTDILIITTSYDNNADYYYGFVAASYGGGLPTRFINVTDSTVTEYMRITAEGNVGIGTTNPQSALHVADGKYAQFEDNNAGPPPAADCDADTERGRISIDTANNRLYICNGAARGWDWVPLNN